VWDTEPVGVFDPHITASGFVLSNRSMVFNGFYRWDYPDIKTYQPELVETQENPQPGSFTFKLRTGVKLHDESETVTADLVKWNIERNLEQGKQQFGGFTGSARGLKAEAVDPTTIKFTFEPASVQNVEAFLAMGSGISCVVSRKAAERLGKEFWRTPVGTGPFTLDKWEYGSSITYKKWPQYFLKDKSSNQLPYPAVGHRDAEGGRECPDRAQRPDAHAVHAQPQQAAVRQRPLPPCPQLRDGSQGAGGRALLRLRQARGRHRREQPVVQQGLPAGRPRRKAGQG
jgi:ABC-type transport system substrate-binding protein